MFSTKKLLAVGSVTIALAAGAFLTPTRVAHAAGAGAVAFVGPTNKLTNNNPALYGGTGVPAAQHCTPSGVGTCGTGEYGFAANGVTTTPSACVGVGTPGAGLCNLTSTGTYANTVCGTGSASGQATVTGTTVALGSATFGYDINFFAGVGVITPSAPGSTSDVVAGVVLIVPTSGNCVTTNVTTFTAVGAAVYASTS